MGSLPTRLLLLSFIACMLRLFHYVGGQGGGVGSPAHIVCSWVPEWAAGGTSPLIFMSISLNAVPFLVSGSAGQDPYPNVLISLCFAGMPFLVSGVPLESKCSFIFHACLSRPPLGSVKPPQPHVMLVLSRVRSINTCLVRVCLCRNPEEMVIPSEPETSERF